MVGMYPKLGYKGRIPCSAVLHLRCSKAWGRFFFFFFVLLPFPFAFHFCPIMSPIRFLFTVLSALAVSCYAVPTVLKPRGNIPFLSLPCPLLYLALSALY